VACAVTWGLWATMLGLTPSGTGTARQLSARWDADMRVDPELTAVAATRAREVLHRRAGPTSRWLDRLKQTRLGDAHLSPWMATGTDPARLLNRVAVLARPDDGPQPTHVGAGWAEHGGRWALVVLLAHRWVEWRVVRTKRGILAARGRPLRGLTEPGLEVLRLGPCSAGDCAIDRTKSSPPYRIALGAPGTGGGFRSVEVLAETRFGPTVVGLWWFGTPPSTPFADAPAVDWPGLARRSVGLPAPTRNPRLERAATLHARRICPGRWAAHRLGTRDSPAARARAQGYLAAVGENVAMAPTVARAHQNLWWSPAHRRLLTDPDVATFGVGRTRSGNRACVVQLFGFGP
jgi:hypothetical protein